MAEAKSIDDHGRLTAARKRLAELQKSSEQHAGDVRQLQTELNAGVAAMTEESELALIENRPADSTLAKEVDSLASKLKGAAARAQTAAGAVQRQRATVDQIEAEIRSRRHGDVLAKVQPIAVRLAALMDESAELAWRIYLAQAEPGEYLQPPEIFAPGENLVVPHARFRVASALINLLNERARFSPALRRELGIVEAETTPVPPTQPIPARPADLYLKGGTIYKGQRPS